MIVYGAPFYISSINVVVLSAIDSTIIKCSSFHHIIIFNLLYSLLVIAARRRREENNCQQGFIIHQGKLIFHY